MRSCAISRNRSLRIEIILLLLSRPSPRGAYCSNGGIGRHAGLKILWPAMAVPVRSRLRVPTKIPDDFNGRLGFLLLVRGRGPRARSRAAANRRSATESIDTPRADGPVAIRKVCGHRRLIRKTGHGMPRRPQLRQSMCRASMKRLIVSGLPVCLPSSSLILHVSL